MTWRNPVFVVFPDEEYQNDEVNDFGDKTKVFDNEESARKFIDEQRSFGYHYDYAIRVRELTKQHECPYIVLIGSSNEHTVFRNTDGKIEVR